MTKRLWIVAAALSTVFAVSACASSDKVKMPERSEVVVSAEALVKAQEDVEKQVKAIAKAEKQLVDAQADGNKARRDIEREQRKLEKAEDRQAKISKELADRRSALAIQQERVRRIESELTSTAPATTEGPAQ